MDFNTQYAKFKKDLVDLINDSKLPLMSVHDAMAITMYMIEEKLKELSQEDNMH